MDSSTGYMETYTWNQIDIAIGKAWKYSKSPQPKVENEPPVDMTRRFRKLQELMLATVEPFLELMAEEALTSEEVTFLLLCAARYNHKLQQNLEK